MNNLTYFIAIVIISTFQDITLFDIHRNMKIITLLSNYSYIQPFLETEVLINARQRVRKCIGSSGLIAINAYVAVDEEVTDAKLLDGVGTFQAITRSSPSITESLHTALKAVIFLDRHACCSERCIAL
jgi:hypothetical protein